MTDLFGNESISVDAGAEFSTDRKYRYALWRIWDKSKPLVMFIGLNPSTANEGKTDPTITRLTGTKETPGIAEYNGFGGFYMMNLFAIVSSKPKILLTDPDPLGDNDHWLEKIAVKCETVVFCWGVFKQARLRAKDIKARFPGAYCLKKTKEGHPWHPLYMAAKTTLIKY